MYKKIMIGFALAGLMSGWTGAFAQQPAPAVNPLDAIPEKMPFDVPYGEPISAKRAREAVAAGVKAAAEKGWKMNVAVVDSGGNLVAFERMDGAQLASIDISKHKARAAAMYRRETKAFENAIQSGLLYALTLDGMIASRGGIPIVDNGKIIGAIGTSGGTGSQDEVTSKAGIAAVVR